MFNRALKDKDPANVKGITKQMIDFAFKGGHGGMVNEAISALDIALCLLWVPFWIGKYQCT